MNGSRNSPNAKCLFILPAHFTMLRICLPACGTTPTERDVNVLLVNGQRVRLRSNIGGLSQPGEERSPTEAAVGESPVGNMVGVLPVCICANQRQVLPFRSPPFFRPAFALFPLFCLFCLFFCTSCLEFLVLFSFSSHQNAPIRPSSSPVFLSHKTCLHKLSHVHTYALTQPPPTRGSLTPHVCLSLDK